MYRRQEKVVHSFHLIRLENISLKFNFRVSPDNTCIYTYMTHSLAIVDESDNPVSSANPDQIYSKGLLHRFASIFIFDTEGRLLLQKRAIGKSHGGLFSESVSAHVGYDENYEQAAIRRIREEIGIDTEQIDLKEVCKIHVNVSEPETEWRKNAFVTIYESFVSSEKVIKEVVINPSEILNVYLLPLGKVIQFFNASPGFFVPCFKYTLGAYLNRQGNG
jgi:isopentenyl-diphosphate Delta-isomerase